MNWINTGRRSSTDVRLAEAILSVNTRVKGRTAAMMGPGYCVSMPCWYLNTNDKRKQRCNDSNLVQLHNICNTGIGSLRNGKATASGTSLTSKHDGVTKQKQLSFVNI